MEAVRILVKALRGRGYSRRFLRSAIKEERKSCRRKVQAASKRILPFIVEFSKTNKNLAASLRGNFYKFLRGKALGEQCRVVAAYKRGRNLWDTLVHSKMIPINKLAPSKTHDTLVRGANRTVHRIPRSITLNQKNWIYLIRCAWCGKRYVGQTKNSMLMRMWGHRYAVRKGIQGGGHFVPHFQRHGVQSIKISGLEHDPNLDRWERLRRERFWIKKNWGHVSQRD